MEPKNQSELAERLRAMHSGPEILVLANAWDVASARIIEHAGFKAVATTSAGIANSLGYPDGQRVSRLEMLDVVRRISNAVSIPVTADMEAGYGETDDSMSAMAREVLAAGAVGINLEDATGDPSHPLFTAESQVRRIRAAKQAAKGAGVDLVINARTDSYWQGTADHSARIEEAIRRGNAYLQAGADSIFVPGAVHTKVIETLCRGISGPVNILAVKGVPPISELQRLGVARVSIGSGLMRAAMGVVRRAVEQLRDHGTYDALIEGALPYAELNELVAGSSRD
jgi:2-methylisocitrate lyase-like PEP mutase family enzyme